MGNTIDSISRTLTVSNIAISLREKILLQQYIGGDMLTEISLSKEYNTSRGSIRAALQALESEGLIATLENGRKQVIGITSKYIEDLYDMRRILECKAVELIISRKNVNFSKLAMAVEAMNDSEKMSEHDLRMTRIHANAQFHTTLFELSDNRPLMQCWMTIEPTIDALAKLNSDTLDIKRNKDDYVDTHMKIFQMLLMKEKEVIEYIKCHIENAQKDTFLTFKQLGCMNI